MEGWMAWMTRSTGIVATALFAGVTMGGCGGSSANAPPPAAASAASASDAEDATADLMEHHRYHHHGGVTLLIAMSLDSLGVSPEQRAAVERIRVDLHARMDPARAAEQALVAMLAEGVTAARFDTAKVDGAVGQVTIAAAAVPEASADALNELHAVLTPPERAALADKVESHWAVWQKANADETGSTNADGGHLASLAADLDLTPDQVDRIRAGLGEGLKTVPRLDPQEIATELRAFGDGFRSEKFDARAVTTASVLNAKLVGWGAAHMAHFVEVVSPVLTPDQRAKLAQRLHEHASHDPSAQGTP
jgi:Spy/CpxP family protein refolding chaperone